MKLIIQIPCFNEATTLPLVLKELPRRIEGIDEIEYQIIDDGSTDDTIRVAKALGVHHVVRVPGRNRRWLGRAFKMGIDNALKEGADIVVNTDGDNQYPSDRIADLVRPIVRGDVHIVIGDRDPGNVDEFSSIKRLLQRLGNWTIEYLTQEPVRDAVSGFRAYSREALLKLHILTNYTYTIDTLIQAHKKGLDIAWIDIVPNRKTRESRLIKNLFSKVRISAATILRMITVYEPFKTFLWVSALFGIPGVVLLARFAYFYFIPGEASGHIQSVIVGGVLLVIAAQMFMLGLLGSLLSINRRLMDEVLTRVRGVELATLPKDQREEEQLPNRKLANL